MPENSYKFELKPLPYDYDALEPFINTQTMQVHHDRLLKAYVDKLNTTIGTCPELQKLTLDFMLRNTCVIPASIRTNVINFGGGVSNHNFFFDSLKPATAENIPTGTLGKVINKQFGSFEKFKVMFQQKAISVFGSGWMWLVKDCAGRLFLIQTVNQNSPLSMRLYPLIVVDVWEHAYFLQYLNLRDQYIGNWFNVINWDKANELYEIH